MLLITLLLALNSPDDPKPGVSEAVELSLWAIDFGDVPRNCQGERVVRVRSRAKEPIRFARTDSDCTCLTSSIDSLNLAPGESTDWRIQLATCGFVGEVRKHVWLEPAQPGQPSVRVNVRYNVVTPLFIRPQLAALGLIDQEPAEATIDIHTLEDRATKLLGSSSDHPHVDVQLIQDVVRRDEPGKLRVRVDAPLPAGTVRATVWVETDHPDHRRVRIPVFGEVVDGLHCDVRMVEINGIGLAQPQTCEVIFRCDPGVQLREIRTSNEAIDIIASERRGEQTTITLRTSAALPLGEFQGHLLLDVFGGDARRVRLPFWGRVVEPNSSKGADTAAAAKPTGRP